MTPKEKLAEMFEMLPNIGPRQAKRFVNFIISKNAGFAAEFSKLIKEIKSRYSVCKVCGKYFENNHEKITCDICSDNRRDARKLMVVSSNLDLEQVEKTDIWDGYYFIIGGPVSTLVRDPENVLNLIGLKKRIDDNAGKDEKLSEIVLGIDSTPEGDFTAKIITDAILPICERYKIKISTLGRGLSTGTEIEYTDTETFKQALDNRK